MKESKVTVEYEIHSSHQEWLEAMATQHDLPNASKALRVLIDHAMEEGDKDQIFGQIRCLHC